MKIFERLCGILVLLLLGNGLILFGDLLSLPGFGGVIAIIVLLILYLIMSIRPFAVREKQSRRLRVLVGGYELTLQTAYATVLSTVGLFALSLSHRVEILAVVVDLLLLVPVLLVTLLNGLLRILFTSSRMRVLWRVLLLLFWWVPLFNLFLFAKMLWLARAEYYFALARRELDAVHIENEDCHTRYPLVLVHGIFFRDWQNINYWGRIPQTLQKCGAVLYYGGQQSAAAVAQSAQELKAHIEDILQESGAEKVNIIAHSKGGLDSRYAISALGLAPHVASLTTINTPHRGCIFAQVLLHKLPKSVVHQMESKYNALFHKLGDPEPDFMGGVLDLTADRCEELNRALPDAEGVWYQSVMSTMKSARSAGFPLNFSWHLVKRYDKEPNDGLVARTAAPWGHFLGEVTVPGRRGISHGDMVDLMREDINGFDIREYYIDLVRALKERGF